MSADWTIVQLKDVTTILGDGLHGTPNYDDDGDYFFINGNNLCNGKVVITDATKRTSHAEYIKHKKNINDRTILVSINGTLGNVAFYNNEKVILGKSACYFNVKDDVNKHFVRYIIESKIFQGYIHSLATGSTIKNVSLKLMREFSFSLPPRPIQDCIAKILKSLDDKIELNTQTSQTLEQIAQAIFKSWFVDFEPVKAKIAALDVGGTQEAAELAAICVISGKDEAQLAQLKIQDADAYQQLAQTAALFPAAVQESELGEIPVGWTTLPLYETAEYINGASFKVEDFSSDRSGLPIIKIAELKQGISEGTKFTTGNFNKRIFIKTHDVLYSWSGSPETSLEVFKWFGGDGWLNQHIFKLNFSSDEQKYFTYYLLKHLKPVLIETAKQKQTTGLGHITVADMKRIKITTPDKAIFLAFGNKVKSLYTQCSVLEKENILLKNVRDSLIPKLLSGEITFSDAEPV